MDKQELRNHLSLIEDEARRLRNNSNSLSYDRQMFSLLTQLTKLVREEIVK